MTFNWVCLKDEAQQAPWSGFQEAIQLDFATETEKKQGISASKAVMVCRRCNHILLHPYEKSDKSNSAIWKHYRKHQVTAPSRPTMVQATIENLLSRPRGITSSELQRLLLETMVTCNWSFDQFDVPVFRSLLHRGYPGHKIPHRHTIQSYLGSAAETAREEIKSRFEGHDGRISLALDCWTSSNRHEFMGTIVPPTL